MARPHMMHHFGYGWDSASPRYLSQDLPESINWQRRGDHYQAGEGLGPAVHPYLKPSQRLHGNVLDAGLTDRLPPRASRKPKQHPEIKPHSAHVLSWPGTGLNVPRHKHFYRPQVDSRNEVRGELPPTAQMLICPGSRPVFPTFSITSRCH